MFVLTADQRDSRASADLVPDVLGAIRDIAGPALVLAPERTTGDEVQMATTDAATVLAVALHLARLGVWSVGIGAGAVELPLPPEIRAARGPAFLAARAAVERAKGSTWRTAVDADEERAAGDAEAVLHLLIELRDRRSAHGWELADLLAAGRTQREAARMLGITESAVSRRAAAAGLRAEEAAVPALGRMLALLDVRAR